MKRPRLSPIWRDRDFRRFWVGETISMVGSGVTQFAFPLVAVLILHVTAGQMGVLRAFGAAPGIAIGLVAGAWVDRVSRRRLLIGLNLLEGALVVSIPAAYALGHLSLGLVYAVWAVAGALGPFWWSAWNALIPAIAGPERLTEANSKMMFSWSATGVTGPGLGGLLVQLMSAPGALLFDAATFIVSASTLATIRLKVPERARDTAEPPMRQQIAEGLRLTFLDPMQRAITTPRAILDLIDATAAAVFFIYVLREVDLDPGLTGLALAISSCGFVGGSLLVPWIERRLGKGSTIVLGLAMVAASPYTMIVANRSLPAAVNVACFALPGIIGGSGGVIQYVALSSLRQSITPAQALGRVFASAGWLGRVLTVAGALLGGFLGETIGLRPTIAICAVAYAIPFVYALSSARLRAAETATVGEAAEPVADGRG